MAKSKFNFEKKPISIKEGNFNYSQVDPQELTSNVICP